MELPYLEVWVRMRGFEWTQISGQVTHLQGLWRKFLGLNTVIICHQCITSCKDSSIASSADHLDEQMELYFSTDWTHGMQWGYEQHCPSIECNGHQYETTFLWVCCCMLLPVADSLYPLGTLTEKHRCFEKKYMPLHRKQTKWHVPV